MTTHLLLNEEKCHKNIDKMVAKANAAKVEFRPHFKTHQSKKIGRWFREKGVIKITVSSLRMAEYFANDGWDDITVAIPVNILETRKVNYLARQCKLNLLFTDENAVRALGKTLEHPIGAFIKIDVGTLRTGIYYDNYNIIDRVIDVIKKEPLIHFKGFLAHAGHSYSAGSKEEILSIHNRYLGMLDLLNERYRPSFPKLEISVGDTPTTSAADAFGCATEIRPGNFVFYDLMQVAIGSCNEEDIAVALACPVIALHPERNEVIIHAGGVHLSKDFLVHEDGQFKFGELVLLEGDSWSKSIDGCFVSKCSQEHGTLSLTDEMMSTIKLGDMIGILPVHSCMTADIMGSYRTMDGTCVDHMNEKIF